MLCSFTFALPPQAAWRGKKVRDSVAHDARVADIRRRISEAAEQSSEDDKLCNRARRAVDSLLRDQRVTQVIDTLSHLGEKKNT